MDPSIKTFESAFSKNHKLKQTAHSVSDAVCQLLSLKSGSPLPKSDELRKKLIKLFASQVLPLYDAHADATFGVTALVIRTVYGTHLSPYLNENPGKDLNQSGKTFWEDLLDLGVVEGVMTYIQENPSGRTAVGDKLYEVLCIMLSHSSSHSLGPILRRQICALLTDSATSHRTNKERLLDSSVMGATRLGEVIARTNDYLVFDALFELVAVLNPKGSKSIQRKSFSSDLFLNDLSKRIFGEGAARELAKILCDGGSDWFATLSSLQKRMSTADLNKPQSFPASSLELAGKPISLMKGDEAVHIDKGGFYASVPDEDESPTTIEVLLSLVSQLRIYPSARSAHSVKISLVLSSVPEGFSRTFFKHHSESTPPTVRFEIPKNELGRFRETCKRRNMEPKIRDTSTGKPLAATVRVSQSASPLSVPFAGPESTEDRAEYLSKLLSKDLSSSDDLPEALSAQVPTKKGIAVPKTRTQPEKQCATTPKSVKIKVVEREEVPPKKVATTKSKTVKRLRVESSDEEELEEPPSPPRKKPVVYKGSKKASKAVPPKAAKSISLETPEKIQEDDDNLSSAPPSPPKVAAKAKTASAAKNPQPSKRQRMEEPVYETQDHEDLPSPPTKKPAAKAKTTRVRTDDKPLHSDRSSALGVVAKGNRKTETMLLKTTPTTNKPKNAPPIASKEKYSSKPGTPIAQSDSEESDDPDFTMVEEVVQLPMKPRSAVPSSPLAVKQQGNRAFSVLQISSGANNDVFYAKPTLEEDDRNAMEMDLPYVGTHMKTQPPAAVLSDTLESREPVVSVTPKVKSRPVLRKELSSSASRKNMASVRTKVTFAAPLQVAKKAPVPSRIPVPRRKRITNVPLPEAEFASDPVYPQVATARKLNSKPPAIVISEEENVEPEITDKPNDCNRIVQVLSKIQDCIVDQLKRKFIGVRMEVRVARNMLFDQAQQDLQRIRDEKFDTSYP